jgi:hypothetical protein
MELIHLKLIWFLRNSALGNMWCLSFLLDIEDVSSNIISIQFNK